ncbi:MAG: DbpA RNA binding domain-containing protein [Spirochaetia bacterium]
MNRHNRRNSEKIQGLFKKAGFHHQTVLQRKITPLIRKGRDLLCEGVSGDGRAASYLVPACFKAIKPKYEINVLILNEDPSRLKRIQKQLQSICKTLRNTPRYALIGAEDNPKNELHRLSANPEILISTPGRVIDHLRRENISLKHVKSVFIEAPVTDKEGFIQDLQYIYSQLPRKRQTVVFTNSVDEIVSEMQPLMRRPLVYHREDWSRQHHEHIFYTLEDSKSIPSILPSILLSQGIHHGIIIYQNKDQLQRLLPKLRKRHIQYELIEPSAKFSAVQAGFQRLKDKAVNMLFLPIHQVSAGKMHGCDAMVFLSPPEKETYLSLFLAFQGASDSGKIITIFPSKEHTLISTLEEIFTVNTKREQEPNQEQAVEGYIQGIVKKIKEDSNPDELNYYRKLFRKNVPFFMRAYFAAYLLKENFQGKKTVDTEDMTSLFISIGKNRRIFPRDLVQLLSSKSPIKKSQIKDVRILDSYSFAKVPSKFAAEIISKLDNVEFRGKKITVNFARKKS